MKADKMKSEKSSTILALSHSRVGIPVPQGCINLSLRCSYQLNGCKWNKVLLSHKYINFSSVNQPVGGWGVHTYQSLCILRAEDNLSESVLSLFCEGPGEWTQIIKLGSKGLQPLSHFTALLDRICILWRHFYLHLLYLLTMNYSI